MLVIQHICTVDVLNPVVLGTSLHYLEHECRKFEIFVARKEIWFPLSRVFPFTNSPGLQIMLQIVMSLSARLARVHGKSIFWSSTSFMATVWLNPRLKSISFSSMMVHDGLSAAGVWATSNIISDSSSSFCLLASLKDFLSSMSLWSLPCSSTSCLAHLPSPPHDKLARFILLVGLNLISFTSYAKLGCKQ